MGEENKPAMNRRSLIKGFGVASTGAAAPLFSSVSGATEKRTGAGEIGISNAVSKLLRKKRYGKAKRLLEKHGVEHAMTSKQVRYNENSKFSKSVSPKVISNLKDKDQKDDQVSTLDNYSSVNLTRATYLISSADSEWSTDMSWNLEDGPQRVDCTGSDDGVGITLNPDNWNINTGSANWNDDDSELRKRGDKGRIVGFDDPDTGLEDWEDGFLSYFLWRTESAFPTTLYGTYTHTWDICGTGGTAATFGLAVGPITVTTGGDYWRERLDHEVQPDGTVQEVTY